MDRLWNGVEHWVSYPACRHIQHTHEYDLYTTAAQFLLAARNLNPWEQILCCRGHLLLQYSKASINGVNGSYMFGALIEFTLVKVKNKGDVLQWILENEKSLYNTWFFLIAGYIQPASQVFICGDDLYTCKYDLYTCRLDEWD